MNVNNTNFMWLTRGKSWGFRFLSEPSGLSSVIKVYKLIFGVDEGRFGYWKGCIIEDHGTTYYVACRCYDENDVTTDEAGRRIPHEFLILCTENEQKELSDLQWGPAVTEKTRNLYKERYLLNEPEVKSCEIDFGFDTTGMLPEDTCTYLDVDIRVNMSTTQRNYGRFFLWLFFFLFLGCIAAVCLFWGGRQKHCYHQDEHITGSSSENHEANIASCEPVNANSTGDIGTRANENVLKQEDNLLRESKP